MADEEKKERRDSESSHTSDSSEEKNDDKEKTSSDDHSDKHSTSSEHENDDASEHDAENDSVKQSSLSEKDSVEDEPESIKEESKSSSRKSSHSSGSPLPHDGEAEGSDHDHSQDPDPTEYMAYHDPQVHPEPNDGSIDSFSMTHVYANAAFDQLPRPDYQDTSGAESPSLRRASTEYERPNAPPSDLGFYTIPLQGTETERPPSSATVIVNPDEGSEWWLTYLYGAVAFFAIFILVLILYFAVGFTG